MTPLKIKLCLHYHCSPVDDPWLLSGAPIVDETFEDLVNLGLLEREGATYKPTAMYRPTSKLHAYVEMLENTPLPELHFIDPRTGDKLTENQRT